MDCSDGSVGSNVKTCYDSISVVGPCATEITVHAKHGVLYSSAGINAEHQGKNPQGVLVIVLIDLLE